MGSFYFLFVTSVFVYVYHKSFSMLFLHLPFYILPIYFLTMFFLCLFSIYYFSHRIFDVEILYEHYKKRIFTAMMDYRYMLVKSFDILFQQSAFLSLVLLLQETYLRDSIIIFLSAVIFGLTHIPLLLMKENNIIKYFVFGSFFGGFIFSYLILTYAYGFVYAYILHWSFYVAIGLLYNIYCVKKRCNVGKSFY